MQRRRFLQHTGAAVAGLVILPARAQMTPVQNLSDALAWLDSLATGPAPRTTGTRPFFRALFLKMSAKDGAMTAPKP